jgi:hypothetical protein
MDAHLLPLDRYRFDRRIGDCQVEHGDAAVTQSHGAGSRCEVRPTPAEGYGSIANDNGFEDVQLTAVDRHATAELRPVGAPCPQGYLVERPFDAVVERVDVARSNEDAVLRVQRAEAVEVPGLVGCFPLGQDRR